MAIEFACPRCHLRYYLNVVGIETHLQEYKALEVTRRIQILVQNTNCSQNKVEPELGNRIQDVNNLFKTEVFI